MKQQMKNVLIAGLAIACGVSFSVSYRNSKELEKQKAIAERYLSRADSLNVELTKIKKEVQQTLNHAKVAYLKMEEEAAQSKESKK